MRRLTSKSDGYTLKIIFKKRQSYRRKGIIFNWPIQS